MFLDESGWADFFIARIGLILFASILLLAAFRVYPVFQEWETGSYLDAAASDIASKIEAVDTTTIPGYRYIYVFDEKNKDIRIEISADYVAVIVNVSTGIWGERELTHAEAVVTHVYPPNSHWSNSSDLRYYLSTKIGSGRNGNKSSPLDFSVDKEKVDNMFNNITSELARHPFTPDLDKPLIIEKVIIHYTNQTEPVARDYVLVYQ